MFDQFAQLYEECLKVSPALTPPVVDDMELWEVAVVLGKALPDHDQHHEAHDGRALPQPPDADDVVRRRYEAIRRRKLGLPELDDEQDSPAPIDPALATLVTTNAPERLR